MECVDKYIVIFSQRVDVSTNDIIDWIIKYDKPYVRINVETDVLTGINFNMPNNGGKDIIELEFGDKKINFSKIHSFWYRRGGIPSCLLPGEEELLENFLFEDVSIKVQTHLHEEIVYLNHYLHYYLENILPVKKIGSKFNANLSKLVQLSVAKKVGLIIPDTIVTNNKKYLPVEKKLITKGIQEVLYTQGDKMRFFGYTEEVNISEISDLFMPSLFQEKLEKDFELRIFYLNKICYSMVIFSQGSSQTSVDFRKYNYSVPNRRVPFKLPKHIEKKIIDFMTSLNLDTGSLDFVVTSNGDFVFLEVNPVGQFGMVSNSCNYNLEKEIVDYLVSD